MKGYRFKDEIAELRDGAHRVCDLELVQVIPLFPNDPLRERLKHTRYVELVTKGIACQIGEKLLMDGILKVTTGRNFVSVTMENILLPDPDTERFVKIILQIRNEFLYLQCDKTILYDKKYINSLLGVSPLHFYLV